MELMAAPRSGRKRQRKQKAGDGDSPFTSAKQSEERDVDGDGDEKKGVTLPSEATAAAEDADGEGGGGDGEDTVGGGVSGGRKRNRKRTRKRESDSAAADGAESKKGVNSSSSIASATAKASGASSTAASSAGGAAEGNPTEVYCEGIPYAAGEADVEAFFSAAGRVSSVRLPRYQDSGKPRGYAHVTFATAAEAAKALTLDRGSLMGRYITVQPAQAPRAAAAQEANRVAPQPRGCRTVFVKNLPYSGLTEEGVAEAFSACGKVSSVRLAVWNHTGKLKGFGYVQFESEKGAEAAVRTQASILLAGRPLIVDYDPKGAPKGSFRTTDGRQWAKVEGAAAAAPAAGRGRGGRGGRGGR